jgi:hypothetical protein
MNLIGKKKKFQLQNHKLDFQQKESRMKFQFQFEEIALCMEKHLIRKLHVHLNLNDCGIFFVPIKLF